MPRPLVASIRSLPRAAGIWRAVGVVREFDEPQAESCLSRTPDPWCPRRRWGWARAVGSLSRRVLGFHSRFPTSPPRGGDSLSARLCCRLAGGTQGSKARPDWALQGTDAHSVYWTVCGLGRDICIQNSGRVCGSLVTALECSQDSEIEYLEEWTASLKWSVLVLACF